MSGNKTNKIKLTKTSKARGIFLVQKQKRRNMNEVNGNKRKGRKPTMRERNE